MRLRTLSLPLVIAAVLAGGCHYMGPPVRLYGTPAELEALAGEWSGEYVGSRLHGRSGSIFFRLVAGEETAHGDVLMTPERAQPYRRYSGELPTGQWGEPVPGDQVLAIRFVSASDGSVTGRLEPYWDPDRRSQADSVFSGHLRGDRIEGVFRTTYATGAESTTGRWSVTRVRRTPRT